MFFGSVFLWPAGFCGIGGLFRFVVFIFFG